MQTAGYTEGQRVRYEVRHAGEDFSLPAMVVGSTGKRVVVEFRHWTTGRMVRRNVRPYRVYPVLDTTTADLDAQLDARLGRETP